MGNKSYLALGIVLCLSLGPALPARAESLLVGGTGSSGPLMKLLFEEFSKQAPGIAFSVVNPPLGSGGGVKALSQGKIDMAVLARPLKAEEKAVLGRYFELGDTPFVLVTGSGQRRNGFTLDELASVYDGRLKTWDSGAPIRLVLRTHDESDYAQMKSMSPAMDKAVTAADRRQGMVYGTDDMGTLELLERTPGSLGPSSLGLLRTTGSRMTALPLNGLTPSVAALKSGSYPWRKTLVVVLPLQASPTAEKFAAFLSSSRAGAVLLRYGYLPASP